MNKIDKKKRIKKECHCEICGEELDEDEVYELDGMILCFDCYHGEDLRAIEENE